LPKLGDGFKDDRFEQGNFRFFELAGDGCGNSFYVQLSDEQQDDATVYFYMHDGGDLFEKVADSVYELLSWPRSKD
jgi:hypothetical protein